MEDLANFKFLGSDHPGGCVLTSTATWKSHHVLQSPGRFALIRVLGEVFEGCDVIGAGGVGGAIR